MRRHKGQMEIMGLAIIIILVSLGLLFAVRWMLKPPVVEPQRVEESVLAANFLSTMLGTTTECNKRTVRDLLQDCALTQGVTKCGGLSSCDYAKKIIEIMLAETFGKWKLNYYFSIRGNAPVIEGIKFGSPCPGAREKKEHPLPVTPTFEIVISLEICR
ncbi:MAG: hypothetical protein QXT19_00860 [Candidatus Woesearchaeota archaeon]